MSILDQDFTVHPVGQGLFYSCKISHNKTVKFRMVFDCGVVGDKWSIDEEVKNYRYGDFENKKILDLLIISHFDSDHISHIQELLKDSIKVKNIVMPFVTFKERLFMTIRYAYFCKLNGFEILNSIIRFLIDPLGTLSDSIDENTKIFLLDDSFLPPIEPTEITEQSGDVDDTRFIFDIDNSLPLDTSEKIKFGLSVLVKGIIKKFKNISKGFVKASDSYLNLMEFYFYKRSIGNDEDVFYEEVEVEFFKELENYKNKDLDTQLTYTIEKIKGIKSSDGIKDILENAYNKVKKNKQDANIIISVVKNMNTTALCLLHKNMLENILNYTENEFFTAQYIEFILTQKFKSSISLKPIEHRLNLRNGSKLNFPNVLLTSDSFLKSKKTVDGFVENYKKFLNDFWLFQIPHHGSNNNADKILFNEITSKCMYFINYGISELKHPSEDLIKDLENTNISSNILFVNEYQGLKFISTY